MGQPRTMICSLATLAPRPWVYVCPQTPGSLLKAMCTLVCVLGIQKSDPAYDKLMTLEFLPSSSTHSTYYISQLRLEKELHDLAGDT